jgi:hypothetical protein
MTYTRLGAASVPLSQGVWDTSTPTSPPQPTPALRLSTHTHRICYRERGGSQLQATDELVTHIDAMLRQCRTYA